MNKFMTPTLRESGHLTRHLKNSNCFDTPASHVTVNFSEKIVLEQPETMKSPVCYTKYHTVPNLKRCLNDTFDYIRYEERDLSVAPKEESLPVFGVMVNENASVLKSIRKTLLEIEEIRIKRRRLTRK